MATLYLLHFSQRVAHAAHYVGYTNRALEARIEDHRRGRGSPLVRALIARGGTFDVIVLQVFGDGYAARAEERRIKNLKGHARVCPICRGRRRCD